MRIKNYRDPLTQTLAENSIDQPAAATTTNQSIDRQSGSQTPEGTRKSQDEMKKESISETASQKELKQIEAFDFDKQSQKIIMIKPINPE